MNKIKLCDINTCTQCYACKTVCPKQCISFIESKDGFLVPKIDVDECIECGACMRTCHQINTSIDFNKPLHNYACWTKDNHDRQNSSSGGAFSVLAKKILDEEGVVYGAYMTENLKVKHIAIKSYEDIIKLQGSKYVQSYLGDTFAKVKENLNEKKLVLFTGTPCQIAGLKTFLKKDYENLFTCDVVCHGVPSQKAFNVYIDRIGLKGKCSNFMFRFTEGWGFRTQADIS